MLKIGFLGGGKMAHAMAKGFIAAGLTKGDHIRASCHPNDTASLENFRELGAEAITENPPVVRNSEIIIISVKPQIVPTALGQIKGMVDKSRLFLSIAMGITINELESLAPENARVIRVMPNTPVLVREGASVFVRGTNATDEDANITRKLLTAVGSCDEITENHMDAVTALSGSGPAYVYVLIEALADGGVKMGLPRDISYRLAAQTVIGAGLVVRETKEHPGVLKDNVTSPAGSTAAGLHYLEEKGFRSAIIGAVEKACDRCREVGDVYAGK
ncbi:pyrroline-5-carboxylate reductase 1, mitochondrial [Chrysoperla carnea]|uniref:pyrroline-5-carboxylate reductase 1, mitochondrial n=1 Tax=Chrysoperla carnea TaxID=189513 RepID=UPI001D079EDE|nr:pyrroline-5-carboxylate reductase 1, mitochondrial [Chrysoperla carnea]